MQSLEYVGVAAEGVRWIFSMTWVLESAIGDSLLPRSAFVRTNLRGRADGWSMSDLP
jgi:hypothetical protein